MPMYNVTLKIEGAMVKTVAKKAQQFFGGDAEVTVSKVLVPHTRTERLTEAENLVAGALSIVEELHAEMESWYDGMPENLQQGDKASQVEEARDALDEIKSALEEVDMSSVSFPGMMG